MFNGMNEGSQYCLIRLLIQRGLGFLYFFAFLIVYFQWVPLLGEHGILPVPVFLKFSRFLDSPSLFFFFYSDGLAKGLAVCGLILSSAVLCGISERYGRTLSVLVWLALWVLYLSFVNVGQLFYGYGWEILLLEAGFLAIFFGSNQEKPTVLILLLFRWLLFRVMFGAGLIKIRGDECWRSLACMQYHYETQPLPNPLSWFFHHTPVWFHQFEVLLTHAIELIFPFFYFASRRLRILAGVSAIGFQILLIFSGNLSWLNYITGVIALSCLDDELIRRVFKGTEKKICEVIQNFKESRIHFRSNQLLFLLVLLLSVAPLMNLISSHQLMNASFDRLHLVNTYGAFGSVSKERYEVVLLGTLESEVNSGTVWAEYQFKGKPGSVDRIPPIVSPYHWKLDWQMWFAAFSTIQEEPWMLNLVLHLLRADPETLSLLDKDPFRGVSPKWIKADLYRYEFTTPEEKKQTGHFWKRRRVKEYFPPLSLDTPELIAYGVRQGWLYEEGEVKSGDKNKGKE